MIAWSIQYFKSMKTNSFFVTHPCVSFGLILLIPLWLNGCHQTEKSNTAASSATPASLPAPKVKIAQPISQTVTEWDEYTGRIEAVNAVEVRARVSGYLEKVNFSAGALVKKGDLLFVIDPKPFKAQLNYALAELERAKSRHELAKHDFARSKNLFKAKAISAEEYDARQNGVRETAAAVQSAIAQVDTAQLNMQFTQVRSPISGRISREFITAGNLVNGSGGDATLLASIVSTHPVYVSVDVDERAVLRYKRQAKQGQKLYGAKVELALADEQGYPHIGDLDYIAPMENPNTGTVNIRGVFANNDELLSAGFFARIRIRGNEPYPALLLPERAIGSDQASHFVWVMDKNKQVSSRKIILGAKVGELRAIKQGLQEQEWVVIDGLQKLKPNSTIEPEKITLTEPTQE